MPALPAAETGEDWLERINAALEAEDDTALSGLLEGLETAEVAHVLEAFPQGVRPRLLAAAGDANRADVLLHMSHDAAVHLSEEVGAPQLSTAAAELNATELAELVATVDDSVAAELLDRLDIVRRRAVEEVLAYPEGTAGRIMHRDVVTVRADTTVAVVLRYLKRRRDIPDNTDQLVVVARDGRFLGTIRVLDLLSSEGGAAVEEAMQPEPVRVDPTLEEQELIRLFLDRDLLSAPVVAEDGALIGRIVASDVMDLAEERAERAMLARGGLDEDEDLFAPLLQSARSRAIWLGANLATAFLAAWVIGLFEATLAQVVALAVLMPIVASMGGIAGSQTLALAIRGLALGQIAPANRWWLLRKEIAIGALNGVLWSLVVGGVAGFWFANASLGVIIAVALVINMVAAALAGLLVPLTLVRLHFDPALAGAVVLTTVTDVVGFLSFLGLATIFLL